MAESTIHTDQNISFEHVVQSNLLAAFHERKFYPDCTEQENFFLDDWVPHLNILYAKLINNQF